MDNKEYKTKMKLNNPIAKIITALVIEKSKIPKGEIVILVSGAGKQDNTFDTKKLISILREEMSANSLRDAVQNVAEISGEPRRTIYSLAIDLTKGNQ